MVNAVVLCYLDVPRAQRGETIEANSSQTLFLSTSGQPCEIEKSKEARKTPPEIASRPPAHTKEANNIDTTSLEKTTLFIVKSL